MLRIAMIQDALRWQSKQFSSTCHTFKIESHIGLHVECDPAASFSSRTHACSWLSVSRTSVFEPTSQHMSSSACVSIMQSFLNDFQSGQFVAGSAVICVTCVGKYFPKFSKGTVRSRCFLMSHFVLHRVSTEEPFLQEY